MLLRTTMLKQGPAVVKSGVAKIAKSQQARNFCHSWKHRPYEWSADGSQAKQVVYYQKRGASRFGVLVLWGATVYFGYRHLKLRDEMLDEKINRLEQQKVKISGEELKQFVHDEVYRNFDVAKMVSDEMARSPQGKATREEMKQLVQEEVTRQVPSAKTIKEGLEELRKVIHDDIRKNYDIAKLELHEQRVRELVNDEIKKSYDVVTRTL